MQMLHFLSVCKLTSQNGPIGFVMVSFEVTLRIGKLSPTISQIIDNAIVMAVDSIKSLMVSE